MIRTMIVLHDMDHPKADRLRVYALRATLRESPIQVCANLTNVYEAGDIVAVAQIGHDFGDDFVIGERKVRGVLSQGMMLGKVEGAVGTDVTADFVDFDPS
jgi:tRNA-binding EMAP/Myf-like protein